MFYIDAMSHWLVTKLEVNKKKKKFRRLPMHGLLGPVVKSIVSLAESLVSDSLSLLVCIKSEELIFCRKM